MVKINLEGPMFWGPEVCSWFGPFVWLSGEEPQLRLTRSPDSPWPPQSKFSVVSKCSETAVSVAEDPSKLSVLQTKNEMYHLFPEAPLSAGKNMPKFNFNI